jgi:hypothetical protein
MVRVAQEKQKRIRELMEKNGQLQAILAEGDKGDGDADITIRTSLSGGEGSNDDDGNGSSADDDDMDEDGTSKRRGAKGKRGGRGGRGGGRGGGRKKPSDEDLDALASQFDTNVDIVSPASVVLHEDDVV